MTEDTLHEVERFLAPILSKCMQLRMEVSAVFADPSTKQIDEMAASLSLTYYRASLAVNHPAMAWNSLRVDDRLSSRKLWLCYQPCTKTPAKDIKIQTTILLLQGIKS